jgi:hypothetical protein
MPPFVPTEEDRAIVKLLVSMGMAQRQVCLRFRGRDGKPIAETMLRVFRPRTDGPQGRGRHQSF